MKIAIVAAIMVLFALPSTARQSAVYGSGQRSCAAWTEARETHSVYEVMFRDWVMGYVSGYNAFGDDFGSNVSGDVAGKTDLQGMLAQMDLYCREHPVEPIVTAASAILGVLLNGD